MSTCRIIPVVAPVLLVLFDVDGTLLLDDEYAHGRAMVRAMRDVWGVDLPDDVVRRVDPWGKTDLTIAREAVATAGVGETGFRERQAAWIEAASSAFQEVAEDVADRWLMREGVASALARLAESRMRLTLLTGNLRPIAQEKMMRVGLLQYLELAIGAYGDDAEERAELVPLARRRAGTPAGPWDVAAAMADGVASVVFASRRFTREALVGATVVVDDTEELVTALLRRARK
jgi:phosphoglycolate phosphatase-like HAD superfamily hydrolase